MSDALAIAAVSKVLLSLLNDIPILYGTSALTSDDPVFSARAPNRITAFGQAENSRINLFLYRVVPNPGWFNRDLPSCDSSGERMTNPRLALDLHYLVTAYGNEEFDSEILLGCAAQLLHKTPVLTRTMIRERLNINPPKLLKTSVLDGMLLADQVEQITISPVPLSTEEFSKLWTALQAACHSSLAYLVSVVLIESKRPARTPLPVLSRGKPDYDTGRDEGVTVYPDIAVRYPTLTGIRFPDNQVSAVPGDKITLDGHDLDGTLVTVICRHNRQGLMVNPEIIGTPLPAEISIKIPDTPYDPATPPGWQAGIYSVQAVITKNGETRTTNTIPMALAPQVSASATRSDNTVTITLSFAPTILPSQDVSLIVGEQELFSSARTDPADSLAFTSASIPAGTYYYRLRVDGVESRLINRSVRPPKFFDSQKVEIP
jgi:hypothetical protein